MERELSGDENCLPNANSGVATQASHAPKVIVASPAAFVQEAWTVINPSGACPQEVPSQAVSCTAPS
jgi:hypothetical protein